jgi:cytochrome c oxidase cbb3-type subunit 3
MGKGGVTFRDGSLLVPLALALAFAGCSPDRGEVHEWSPADHKQAEGQPDQVGAPTGSSDPTAMLVETTWLRTCATCHGRGGRGDGPQGAMMNASDLTKTQLSDADLAQVIRQGRNRMPGNPDLPQAVVAGLVAHIRELGQGQ